MITRISDKPSVSLTVWPTENSVYCIVRAEAPRLRLKSDPLMVSISASWDFDAQEKLVRLRQDATSYVVDDDSEIIGISPMPPENDQIRTSNPKLYCKEWDDYYEARSRHADLKRNLLDQRRQHMRRLLAEADRLSRLLSESPEVTALLLHPIPMNAETPTEERFFALYRGTVWSAARKFEPEQWRILAERKLERENAQLAVALAMAEPSLKREPIPSQIRRAVWTRDQGKCVRCGSRQRLEFDHIIPVSHGGGNTERNIELLCEVCNRGKSNSII